MNTTGTEVLEARIEAMVREHIEASQAAVAAAVRRAFADAAVPSRLTGRPAPAGGAAASKKRPPKPRRSAAELDRLSEAMCSAIVEEPGQTMSELAPKVGVSPAELSVVAVRLRRANRVRTTGQRQFTKYFPAAPTATE